MSVNILVIMTEKCNLKLVLNFTKDFEKFRKLSDRFFIYMRKSINLAF